MHAMQINEVFATFFLYLKVEKSRKMHDIRNAQISTSKAHQEGLLGKVGRSFGPTWMVAKARQQRKKPLLFSAHFSHV
jgi:hypothetical protein